AYPGDMWPAVGPQRHHRSGMVMLEVVANPLVHVRLLAPFGASVRPGPLEPRRANAVPQLLVPDMKARIPHLHRAVVEPHDARCMHALPVWPLSLGLEHHTSSLPGEAIG